MTIEKLHRVLYAIMDGVSVTFQETPSGRTLEHDFVTYHDAQAMLHEKAEHDWGVATGLEVRRTGDSQLRVGPGVAIDRHGRLIALSDDDAGDDKQPGITITTGAKDSPRSYLVIRYAVRKSDETVETSVPWKRELLVEPAVELISKQRIQEEQGPLVLAVVDVDTNGKITGLNPSLAGDPLTRKLVGVPAGEIRLRRPEVSADGKKISDADVVTIRPTAQGHGVAIDGDLEVAAGKRLTIGTNVLVVGADGNVGIGEADPKHRLKVKGDTMLDGKVGIGAAPDAEASLRVVGSAGNQWFAKFKPAAKDLTSAPNWAGGIHTWDLFAEGAIGCGTQGEPKCHLSRNGDILGTNSITTQGKATAKDLDVSGGATFKGSINQSCENSSVVIDTKGITLGKTDETKEGGSLNFGSYRGQLINLHGTGFGIGIQARTQYFRSTEAFAWYQGGSHQNEFLNENSEQKPVMAISNGYVGIGTLPDAKYKLKVDGSVNLSGLSITKETVDTAKSVMSGAANGYQKAQFTMNGGGTVTWNCAGSVCRLKWTKRFVAICMGRSGEAIPAGHISVSYPTTKEQVTSADGVDRFDATKGIWIKGWEALYAVHTVGGNHDAVQLRIENHNTAFDAPSNWLLIAVVNDEDWTVKLGTGAILSFNSSSNKGCPLPCGTILMWHGASDQIPNGWQLCDGTNDTPDLRDRFVVGAGSTHIPKAKGGTDKVALSLEQIPKHNHAADKYCRLLRVSDAGEITTFERGDATSGEPALQASGDIRPAGGNSAGGTDPHENMPPYFALCYIMKLF